MKSPGRPACRKDYNVTPLAGVGIEMKPSWEELMKDPVTPLAGVGIEIL